MLTHKNEAARYYTDPASTNVMKFPETELPRDFKEVTGNGDDSAP
jgi:hypothetical protein